MPWRTCCAVSRKGSSTGAMRRCRRRRPGAGTATARLRRLCATHGAQWRVERRPGHPCERRDEFVEGQIGWRFVRKMSRQAIVTRGSWTRNTGAIASTPRRDRHDSRSEMRDARHQARRLGRPRQQETGSAGLGGVQPRPARKAALHATGNTGRLLGDQLGLPVTTYCSGPLGGDQQIGARIVDRAIDILIFFWDPLEPQPHDPDVKALLRITVVWKIPVACNRATADFLVSSPLMETEYERRLPDYEGVADLGATIEAGASDRASGAH